MTADPKMKATVRHVVSKLVQGDYEALESLTGGRSLSAIEMAQGVVKYGDNLIPPPDSEFESLDIVEVERVQPRRWSVNFDLWTVEDGRSDLTLTLTLSESDKDLYSVQIDSIHVL